jgi:uncharacterized protein (DUF2336 family)
MFPKLEGLDSLARRDGVDIRPTLLRVLTDLYVQRPAHSAEEERHYTELALRLIDAVDVATRATVARKLSFYPNAPLAVMRRLARDVIEVAEPVLVQSPVLTDLEHAAIIRDFGLGHAAAIARRHAGAPESPPPAAEVAPARLVAGPASEEPADLELAALFFSADGAERRVLLMNLADAETGATPMSARPALTAVPRLEAAALARDAAKFAMVLEQMLGLAREPAARIVEDASGEPLLVALKALETPSVVVQRVLLFLNPAIGHSVQRVFDLASLYERLSARAAARIIASLRAGEPGRPRRGAHQPVYADDEASRGRRGTGVRRPSAASETRAGARDEKPAGSSQKTRTST